MNFVRSRLTVVGLLAAWPMAQLVGCAAKDREYGPANSAGDDGSGGTNSGGKGGTGKGGSSGKGSGGTNASGASGGAAGEDDGSGGTGGKGGTSSGKGGTSSGKGGSSGTSNAAGDAGAGAETNGGEGGEGPIPDPDCVPTGVELCSDGLDNDCDGATDCLVLQDEFPTRNGAASGADVAYTFSPIAAGGSFQCRVSHGTAASGSWRACAGVSGSTIHPFSDADAADPSKNGLYTTEVRVAFAGGGSSLAVRRSVYIHDSLYGATRCDAGVPSTDAWVTAATPYLPDAGAFDTSTVRNPFVEVDFDPLPNGTFEVAEGDGIVHWSTLRRRFSFSSDNHYLVMTRNYSARNSAGGMGCLAMVKRVHMAQGDEREGVMAFQNCQAVVFNKKGAGYCLTAPSGTPESAEYDFSSAQMQLIPPDYSPDADNFAWRKMTAFAVGAEVGRISSNLSPKCDEDGCATGYTLFLPDKALFPYWAP